ncbi:hypothetical protein GCM10011369_31420 [Neiella marina]|uniref:Uncharacterized protein n=1 Tax=Neiella marina TaxID=508461 RepID=A0A8J2U8W2_9GAMM|nr:hypothetical protein GCM10011369_31420 [Neiella marina]
MPSENRTSVTIANRYSPLAYIAITAYPPIRIVAASASILIQRPDLELDAEDDASILTTLM